MAFGNWNGEDVAPDECVVTRETLDRLRKIASEHERCPKPAAAPKPRSKAATRCDARVGEFGERRCLNPVRDEGLCRTHFQIRDKIAPTSRIPDSWLDRDYLIRRIADLLRRNPDKTEDVEQLIQNLEWQTRS